MKFNKILIRRNISRRDAEAQRRRKESAPLRLCASAPLREISFFIIVFCSLTSTAQEREEFVGPFNSWANVKLRFGAKGDGLKDDTKSLQDAIDNLSNPVNRFNIGATGYMVIYLPAGIYKISQTLVLKGKIGVSIIGEDPKTTQIRWAGDSNRTMLLANGSAYFKISRLTWDANRKKGIEGIGIHWKEVWRDSKTQSFASLNIELSDNIFSGGFDVGIGGGTSAGVDGTGSNDSEITIRRCTFIGCLNAGIRINGYNALDYWIWNCRFLDCRIGIYSTFGNYHVYQSYFKASKDADVWNYNGYYISVRNCYSVGSRKFSVDDGASCNPFKRIFERNIVVDCEEIPIQYHHLGTLSLMENVFTKSKNKNVLGHIYLGSWCPGNYFTLSINNKYDYDQPIRYGEQVKTIFRNTDSIFKRAHLSSKILDTAIPLIPLKTKRRIFEVSSNASATEIQKIIDEAVQLKGSRPVIHFPFGQYLLDKQLTIPAGSDMQLIGDGYIYGSVLAFAPRKAAGYKSLLLVEGPTYITIQDIQIGSSTGDTTHAAGVCFKNVDQKGAVATIDQMYSMADTSLYVDRLNYLYIEKNNSFFTAGNYISGGAIQKSGKGTLSVNCFGGQYAKLTVVNNANFVAKDCWWEGNTRIPLNIKGDGTITIDGAMVAPIGADSSASIRIDQFSGKITLQNMYLQGALFVRPENKNLQLLAWNIHFYHKLSPLYFVTPRANYNGLFAGLSAQCFDGKNPACSRIHTFEPVKVNVPDASNFFKNMTISGRKSMPARLKKSTPGVTNIYVSRVVFGLFDTAVKFETK